MPVETRSKRLLLATAQAAKVQLSFNSFETVKQPSKTTKPTASKQLHERNGVHSSMQKISNEFDGFQDRDGSKPLQIITKPPSPDSLLDNTLKSSWPCQQCSCEEGTFRGLDNSCVTCRHHMDDHMPHGNNPWDAQCDHVCEREDLVTSVLQRVRQYGVVVIRATPQVGKTALLKLLGHRIVRKELDLEPVYISWEGQRIREGTPYEQYLEAHRAYYQQRNATIRGCNSGGQTIYLIDEAQGSYEETSFWSSLKNYRGTRTQSLYVLVCVYGAVGVSRIRDPSIESQALRIHTLQRIELRPSAPGELCMLFQKKEVGVTVGKFAIYFGLKVVDGVVDYLYHATDGHPGMIGLILSHYQSYHRTNGIEMSQTFSPQFLHKFIVEQEKSFVEWLSQHGRGVWSPGCEDYVQNECLPAPQYSHLKLLDIKIALREVAMQPNGLSRLQEGFDAYSFCHKWGLLHIEQPAVGRGETTFVFASPLHRRVAYRRLFPGREPDAVSRDISLQQICTNAVARFSPGALQPRWYPQSNGKQRIPEAAFQDELYCCLNLELHYLPILSEYSHTTDGRIDFYVSDKNWGIEVLQCGSDAEIAKHAARFTNGGRYYAWGIMDDYIILNFCPRSLLRKIKIEDGNIQSHVFHVVIEPDELVAEIYSHDKQLQKSWSLSEGRQRTDTDVFSDLNTANHGTGLTNGSNQGEPAIVEELRVMRLQMEREKEMRLQVEREKEEMRLQIERERKGMRLRTEQEENRDNPAQEQDKLVLRRDRKRKR